MLYTKFQPESVLGSGEKDFKCFCCFFLPYMHMAAILFNDTEPFEKFGYTVSTYGSM